jgi:hypothetical protein
LNAGRRKERKSDCAFIEGYVAGLWRVNAYLNPTDGEFIGRYASVSGLAFSSAFHILYFVIFHSSNCLDFSGCDD